MVASEEEEVVGEFDLECEEEAYGFDALLSSVDIVAEEEVVRARWEAPVLEQPEEVVVLAVDVT